MPDRRETVRNALDIAKVLGVKSNEAIADAVIAALDNMPDAAPIGPPREHCGRTQCTVPHDWLRNRRIVRCPGGTRYPDPKEKS